MLHKVNIQLSLCNKNSFQNNKISLQNRLNINFTSRLAPSSKQHPNILIIFNLRFNDDKIENNKRKLFEGSMLKLDQFDCNF